MDYKNINFNAPEGFEGFVTIAEFRTGTKWTDIPDAPGVYFLQRRSEALPVFLETGTGGFFKGEDPNVPLSDLQDSWIPETSLLYIGKAKSLRPRIQRYVQFGLGKNVGHRGGRRVWQIADAADFEVCWLATPDKNPRAVERRLIQVFKRQHNERRPFANRQD